MTTDRSGAKDVAREEHDDEDCGERGRDGHERGADEEARVAAHPFARSTRRNEYGAPNRGVTSNVSAQLPTM